MHAFAWIESVRASINIECAYVLISKRKFSFLHSHVDVAVLWGLRSFRFHWVRCETCVHRCETGAVSDVRGHTRSATRGSVVPLPAEMAPETRCDLDASTGTSPARALRGPSLLPSSLSRFNLLWIFNGSLLPSNDLYSGPLSLIRLGLKDRFGFIQIAL